MARERIDTLTSLRFFAAAAIVWFHFTGFYMPPGTSNSVWATGVSFYFVLSGFILTYSYGHSTGAWLGRYYLARFARIWPLHLTTFIIVVASYTLTAYLETPTGAAIGAANLLLLHAWVPSPNWVMSFNSVSWSLSVEAFFYVVFPLLCGIRKLLLAYLVAVACVVSTILVTGALWPLSDTNAPVPITTLWIQNPAFRLPEFMLGMVAARWFSAKPPLHGNERFWTVLEITAVCGVFGFGWLTSLNRPWMVGYAGDIRNWLGQAGGMPFFAFLIFVFAHQSGLVSKILSNRVMIRLGDISFATFMIHLVVFGLVATDQSLANNRTAILLAVPLIYVASFALWRFVEVPSRRLIMAIRLPAPSIALPSHPASPAD